MASPEDEKKGKSGLLGRWFRGGEAPAPVEASTSTADEAELVVQVPLAEAPAPLAVAPAAQAPKQSWLHRLREGQPWKDLFCVFGCWLIDSHVG